ncbi:MAG: hypothetical protein LBM65_05065 [Oscillospiraceae bacterium]|jgi:hypothetical protein|nr:hypothetical protein [Oscillospiraceae bacterium]
MPKHAAKHSQSSKPNKLRAVIAIAAALLMIIALLLCLHWCNPNGDFPLDPNAKDITEQSDQTGGKQGVIRFPGWGDINLKADVAQSRINLLNPSGNNCYVKFTFGLAEGDTAEIKEVLYQSGYVPPGKAIGEQTLSRGLAKGTYNAVVQMQTVTMDELHTPLNGNNVKVTLIVN